MTMVFNERSFARFYRSRVCARPQHVKRRMANVVGVAHKFPVIDRQSVPFALLGQIHTMVQASEILPSGKELIEVQAYVAAVQNGRIVYKRRMSHNLANWPRVGATGRRLDPRPEEGKGKGGKGRWVHLALVLHRRRNLASTHAWALDAEPRLPLFWVGYSQEPTHIREEAMANFQASLEGAFKDVPFENLRGLILSPEDADNPTRLWLVRADLLNAVPSNAPVFEDCRHLVGVEMQLPLNVLTITRPELMAGVTLPEGLSIAELLSLFVDPEITEDTLSEATAVWQAVLPSIRRNLVHKRIGDRNGIFTDTQIAAACLHGAFTADFATMSVAERTAAVRFVRNWLNERKFIESAGVSDEDIVAGLKTANGRLFGGNISIMQLFARHEMLYDGGRNIDADWRYTVRERPAATSQPVGVVPAMVTADGVSGAAAE